MTQCWMTLIVQLEERNQGDIALTVTGYTLQALLVDTGYTGSYGDWILYSTGLPFNRYATNFF